VTRRYPRLIRRDAAKLWRSYRKYRTVSSGGILPAWAADEYLLGRAAVAAGVSRGRQEAASRSRRQRLSVQIAS